MHRKKGQKNIRQSSVRLFGLKYALVVSALAVLATGAVVWLASLIRLQDFDKRVLTRAVILQGNIQPALERTLRNEDATELRGQLARLHGAHDVVDVWIYDNHNRLVWQNIGGRIDHVSAAPGTTLQEIRKPSHTTVRGIPVTTITLPIHADSQLIGYFRPAYDRSALRQEFMTDLSFGVIFITTLTATGLLLGWRIGNLLTARLNVLRQGIMQVREGNLTSRLDMPPEQELADLTENFNSMTEELDSYRQQVANNQERLEQQVAEACEKLELSHRKLANAEKMAAVGELAGSVAHEISNPLTSIHIRAQLLLESVDDALSKKGLEDIIDQSFRCQVTLRGLVSYASQSGSQRTNIQVKNMLSRCAAVAMPHCDKMPNPEEVKLSIPANLPPVKGDPSQLEHVFICLLDFACTVRAEGTEIEVSAEESEGMIEIVITARARSTTAEPLQPTNGLALCKALIQDHRGTLEETIDEQNGWRWITRLPLNR